MKKEKRTIVWFRKDLRLHDNEALTKALENSEEIIPVYIFNQIELVSHNKYHFQKTGHFRAQFLLESIAQLQANLKTKGVDLIIRQGKPEEEIFKLVQELEATTVYANMERTHDEVESQNALEKKLWSVGLEISFFRGKMLYYTQDLPFPIAHTPDSFSAFRKEVERFVFIRDPLPAPSFLNPLTIDIDLGKLPTLEELGYHAFKQDARTEMPFNGGEAFGLERLYEYFVVHKYIETFEESHIELMGTNISSKLSPWLALGCVSPKLVYAELKNYEKNNKASKSSQSFFVELLWRDHCRLLGKKYGDKIFEIGGISGVETKTLVDDMGLLQQWIDGKTSCELINACMLQLKHTGYLTHKGRQIVSSYLVNDLQVNWQMGASYFEHILIDYDICSNWVNWNIVGGVGPDAKDDRYINIENQIKRLDPKGEFTALWLDEVL